MDVLSVASALRKKHGEVYLLHSALSNKSYGRYSIIGYNPFKIIDGDNLDGLYDFWMQHKAENASNWPFCGGLIGFFSYDFGLSLHGLESSNPSQYACPKFYFAACRDFYVFDHVTQTWNTDLPEIDVESNGEFSAGDVQPEISNDTYNASLKKIKQYLYDGETYQVNYAQGFSADFTGDPWSLYKKVTEINPSPFQCYLPCGDLTIVSNSPERLVMVRDQDGKRMVQSRPIKGTAPRGLTIEEEKKYAAELLSSDKDAAELIMIVDLVRNDLGQVCEVGSVYVPAHRSLEIYSHVQHTVSTVEGNLCADKDWRDVIRALFPGGSITGCPKHRTMQIIDQLEEHQRGVYCGAAGYISFDGQCDFNIMIRTFAVADNRVFFNAGGGIVYDSVSSKEYDESVDKARALMAALRS